MAKIHKLSPALADMIAAGEVVERPASVIKELVENAIDAGAKKITVEINNGGITFMRVTDDGCGMSGEDAPTAFLRHATSKISCAEDLGGIATMGFRGEALAAISAVSKVDLMTRSADSDLGVSVRVEAGNVMDIQPAGCPVGTTMIVRELFYNTPARMKFMKRDSVEGSYISGAVQRQALGHPEIAFRFIRDGKPELSTPGDGKLISAIYAAMGRSSAKDMVEVNYTATGVRVTGFVGKPTASRGSRSYQHFFVNGRYVKSKMMAAALEEAYKNQIMVGRFPICVLHVEVAPTAVDVNVHPAKTEVKFLREGDVFDAIHYGVLGTLSRTEAKPEMELKNTVKPREDFFRQVTAEEYKTMIAQQEKPAKAAEVPGGSLLAKAQAYQAMREKRSADAEGVHDSVRNHRPVVSSPLSPEPEETPEQEDPFGLGQFLRQAGSLAREAYTPPTAVDNGTGTAIPVARRPVDVRVDDAIFDAFEEPETVEQTHVELPPITPPEPEKPQPVEIPKKTDVLPYRIIGQAFDTYIIVEQGDGLLLIDKHAAHERILFEKLKAQKHEVMSQVLMTPMEPDLREEERTVLLGSSDTLERLGFALEGDGKRMTVKAIPCDIDVGDAEACLSELAENLMEGKKLSPETVYDELLHTVACKAAIKGGQKSDPRELSALVAELMGRDDIKYCPHGRPVCISLTRNNLEHQFKRS